MADKSIARYLVKLDSEVNLDKWDPNEKNLCPKGKIEGLKELLQITRDLEVLQELLYAEGKHKILIVLQAMDTGGKDGVIRHVFEGVNPQGVRVACFKQPTPEELAHDFLWRVHKHTPGAGEIAVFNRSHYEDILVVRVHELVPKSVWSKRYEHINAFERMLADEGTTILKFYLHISPEEQKDRLQDRLDEPNKRWKFNLSDLEERKSWRKYKKAYEETLSRTSKPWSPWYVIPANRKWYRNLIIGRVIVKALRDLKMKYPAIDFDPKDVKIE